MITLSLLPVPRRALPGALSLRQGAGGPPCASPERWSEKEMSLCIAIPPALHPIMMVPWNGIVAGPVLHGFPPAGAPFMGTDVTYDPGGLV